jgi:hypothetical protein
MNKGYKRGHCLVPKCKTRCAQRGLCMTHSAAANAATAWLRSLIAVLAILVFSIFDASATTQVISDDFNRGDSADLGVDWTQQTGPLGTFSIVSNRVRATTLDTVTGENHNATLSNDQYAEVTLTTFTGTETDSMMLILRASASAQTYYQFEGKRNDGGLRSQIRKYVAGALTVLVTETSTTWTSGDVLRAEAAGQNLRLLRNGTLLLSTTDASIAGGRAGMLAYVQGTSSLANVEFDNFSAGNFDFQSIGTLGSTQSSTANQASLVLTTTAACESANTCACAVAVDNNQTTDGDEAAVTITDSASNSWIKAVEFTNGQGTAQTGATVHLGYTKAGTTIANGGTITATFTNSTSRDASAMTCWEFSNSLSNYTLSVPGTATLATDGADPGAITISSLSSLEYLWLHGLAAEGPNSDAYTWDTDYTQFSANGTGATAPAFDVATESATWTTTPDPFTFSHAGASSGVKAALVLIYWNAASTDLITSVTYGGTAMTRVVTIGCDSAGEPGCATAYHLGASVPQGTQTVSIDHTATSDVKIATAVTLTGGFDTEVCGAGTISSGDPDDPQIAVNCTNAAQRYSVIFSGLNDPTNLTVIAGMSTISDHDFGTKSGRVDRETGTSSGSTTVGYTATGGDDVSMVAFGVSSIDVAASNMHIRGGFRIFTGTTDTVDSTSTTADRDYAQVFAALLATVGVSTCNKGSLALLGVGC